MSGTGPTGATRNRTDLFIKYRNQARGATRPLGYSGSPSSQAERGTHRLLEAALATTENGASAAELGAAGVASMLPPRYVDFKEAIRTEMFVIKQKMNELRDLHGRAALTTFDDSNSREMDIEVLTQDITRLFRKCEARLQQFGTASEPTSEADKKVKGNVQRTLAIELQKLSIAFRKQQKTYLSKLAQARTGSGSTAGGNFAALYEQSPTRGAFGGVAGGEDEHDPGFSEQQAMRVDTLNAFVDERDREVANILRSINELGQVMKDLSVLVIEQGTILDRIDYQMEQVAVSVGEGVKQLVRAEKSQKQSRLILCIMFLVCAVVLLLLIVVLKKIIIG